MGGLNLTTSLFLCTRLNLNDVSVILMSNYAMDWEDFSRPVRRHPQSVDSASCRRTTLHLCATEAQIVQTPSAACCDTVTAHSNGGLHRTRRPPCCSRVFKCVHNVVLNADKQLSELVRGNS